MTCLDWELEIAGDSESEALREHLQQCESCREFAVEIASNREALRTLPVDPAAFELVRGRVMAGIGNAPRHGRSGWVWAAAVAACLAMIAVSLTWLRFPSAPRTKGTELAIAPPPLVPPEPLEKVQNRGPHRHAKMLARARRPSSSTESLVVKMLTDDPNVVIIWIADQKGDSL